MLQFNFFQNIYFLLQVTQWNSSQSKLKCNNFVAMLQCNYSRSRSIGIHQVNRKRYTHPFIKSTHEEFICKNRQAPSRGWTEYATLRKWRLSRQCKPQGGVEISVLEWPLLIFANERFPSRYLWPTICGSHITWYRCGYCQLEKFWEYALTLHLLHCVVSASACPQYTLAATSQWLCSSHTELYYVIWDLHSRSQESG